MLRGLDGRRALVTGASGGIGAAIGRALHDRGAHVLLSGRRVEALEALAAELGDRAEVLPADLAGREEAAELAARAGVVDLLVANAALPASGPLLEYEPAQIDRALDVNLRAPVQLARALAPGMIERGAGQLVFIASMSAKTTTAGQSLYSATKWGMRGFSLALREDLRGTGVGVSTIFPGFVSDAGMFAETGLRPPPGLGTVTPAAVARAVLRAAERDRGEIDVAPPLMRASALVFGLSPALASLVARRLGSAGVAARIAERQRGKR